MNGKTIHWILCVFFSNPSEHDKKKLFQPKVSWYNFCSPQLNRFFFRGGGGMEEGILQKKLLDIFFLQ